MHETRFVNEIFAVLNQKIGKNAVSGQIAVNARLSPFSHVTPEGLRGSFKELSKAEGFKNVRLKILPLEILLECKNCNRISRIAKRIFACPFCNSMDINIQMDKEFFVESVEIQHKEKEVKDGN